MENKLFEEKMSVINLGLPSFFESVKDQGAPCVHVDWRPPAGGAPRQIEFLDGVGVLGCYERRRLLRGHKWPCKGHFICFGAVLSKVRRQAQKIFVTSAEKKRLTRGTKAVLYSKQ